MRLAGAVCAAAGSVVVCKEAAARQAVFKRSTPRKMRRRYDAQSPYARRPHQIGVAQPAQRVLRVMARCAWAQARYACSAQRPVRIRKAALMLRGVMRDAPVDNAGVSRDARTP